MISYEKGDKDEMVLDVPYWNIMVIDVDCSGLILNDVIEKRIQKEHPKAYKDLIAACLNNNIKPGMVLTTKRGGRDFAFIFLTKRKSGFRKSTEDDVVRAFDEASKTLLSKYGNSWLKYSSGILGRELRLWNKLCPIINKCNFTWFVHPR